MKIITLRGAQCRHGEMKKAIRFTLKWYTGPMIPPEVHIFAKPHGGDNRLSPKLTSSEFSGYIDYLIEELEALRTEGNKE